MFVHLTHLRSGTSTYIKAESIINIQLNFRGETLVLFGNKGQYVQETPLEVMEKIQDALGGK